MQKEGKIIHWKIVKERNTTWSQYDIKKDYPILKHLATSTQKFQSLPPRSRYILFQLREKNPNDKEISQI